MEDFKDVLIQRIKAADPSAFGDLQVEKSGGTFFVNGELHTSVENPKELVQSIFAEEYPESVAYVALKTHRSGLSVHVRENDSVESSWSETPDEVLDEVSPLYTGMMETRFITPNPKYKKLNFETIEKVKNAVAVTGVLAPLVLDRNLRVIDGGLRLEVAEILELSEVPVLVLNCSGDKADSLRLLLNRSSEFQRWVYEEVDAFVDSMPQLQPLLEPLGFFSNNILPTTFFGNTVLEYVIDEYNDQMKLYSQDIGLAEWAKMRREEIRAAEERKAERLKRKPSSAGKVSLFDLAPQPEDFVEVVDPRKVVSDHVDTMMEVADGITEAYDDKRRAEKEARGQVWQTARRTSKKLAKDKRAAAEAEAEASAKELVDREVTEPDGLTN